MKFWSNVEKEYNDLFGDGGDESKQENVEESKMESEFNRMFNDIKKDLKNVPKEDLLPGISSIPDGNESEEEEDEELDEEDEKKALKTRERKRKSEKKCKVSGKTYEVGERWKDPKTGKEMICILMNIPKDVQPRLAEADVTITSDKATPEPEEPDLKPTTSGAQWAYTNKQSKIRGCPSDKESEKPDQVGSEAEKDDAALQAEKAEDSSNEDRPLTELSLVDKGSENVDKDDTQEEQTGEVTGLSDKDSDSRENGEKQTDDNSGEGPSGNEAASARLKENGNNEGDDEETESDTDSEEEKRQTLKESQNDDDSEYEEREEDKVKYKTDDKDRDINVTKEDRETSVVQAEEPKKSAKSTEKRPEYKTETDKEEETHQEVNGNVEDRTSEESTSPEVTQEKGKTIYTKETTVTQRKLFKTSETVESIETEKNVD